MWIRGVGGGVLRVDVRRVPVPAVPLPPVSRAPRLNAAWKPTPVGRVSLRRERDSSGRSVRSWHTTSSSGCGAEHSLDVRDDGARTGMTVDSIGSCLYNPCVAMVELASCRWSHGPSIQRDAGRTSVPKINGVRAPGRYPTGVLVVAGAHRQAQTPFLSKQTCEGA